MQGSRAGQFRIPQAFHAGCASWGISVKSSQQSTGVASVAEHTEQLRRQGLADIERRCGPAKRIDRRKHLYECRDGTQFLLRTNKKKILIIETNGTSADATIALEQTPNVLFSIPGATYLIPSAEIGRDARKDHETWLKQASTKGGNQTWQMIFDETDDLCHFYAVRYAQFRIAAT